MNRIRQEQEIAQRELYEEEVARPGETSTPGQSSSHDGYGDAKEGGGEDIDDMDGDDPAQARPRFANGERVYDDDDAELQAALRASLKNVPEGFVLPNGPTLAGMSVPVMATTGEGSEVEEGDTFSEGDNKPSVDEIRRMRLARFEA
jgi:ataxin-3